MRHSMRLTFELGHVSRVLPSEPDKLFVDRAFLVWRSTLQLFIHERSQLWVTPHLLDGKERCWERSQLADLHEPRCWTRCNTILIMDVMFSRNSLGNLLELCTYLNIGFIVNLMISVRWILVYVGVNSMLPMFHLSDIDKTKQKLESIDPPCFWSDLKQRSHCAKCNRNLRGHVEHTTVITIVSSFPAYFSRFWILRAIAFSILFRLFALFSSIPNDNVSIASITPPKNS